MRPVLIAFRFSLLLAAAPLLTGFLLAGLWLWAVLPLALTATWWLLEPRRWTWLPSAELLAYLASAAAGLLLDLPAVLPLLTTVAALAAWDLQRFLQRLAPHPPDAHTARLQFLHLHRLLAVNALGLLLAALTLGLQFRLNLWLAILAGLTTILALGRLMGTLKLK